jgi:hypothetical protein
MYNKNLTLTTMTSSLTLEAIEFLSSQSFVGSMVKPNLSMFAKLFYNVVKLVLMMYEN